jgi:hypothetical protein
MNKLLTQLSRGGYVADFRKDEGLRIRKEFISPCLTSSLKDSKQELTYGQDCILLVIVDEDQTSDKDRIHRST